MFKEVSYSCSFDLDFGLYHLVFGRSSCFFLNGKYLFVVTYQMKTILLFKLSRSKSRNNNFCSFLKRISLFIFWMDRNGDESELSVDLRVKVF